MPSTSAEQARVMLPYVVRFGSLLALLGALALAAFGALNLWHACFGDAESPGLNVAFGALLLLAAAALVAVAALASLVARRLRSREGPP